MGIFPYTLAIFLLSFLKIFSLPLPWSPAPFSLFMMHRYGLSIISLRSSTFFLYVLITLHLSLVKCSNYFSVFKAWYLELFYFSGTFLFDILKFSFPVFQVVIFSFFEPLYWISLSCPVLNSLFPMFVLGFTLEFIFVMLGFFWKYL